MYCVHHFARTHTRLTIIRCYQSSKSLEGALSAFETLQINSASAYISYGDSLIPQHYPLINFRGDISSAGLLRYAFLLWLDVYVWHSVMHSPHEDAITTLR
jgi:hypothetical protein